MKHTVTCKNLRAKNSAQTICNLIPSNAPASYVVGFVLQALREEGFPEEVFDSLAIRHEGEDVGSVHFMVDDLGYAFAVEPCAYSHGIVASREDLVIRNCETKMAVADEPCCRCGYHTSSPKVSTRFAYITPAILVHKNLQKAAWGE
jgi:hypothetical protein